jgi:F-type H+-transporting ATPase subunit c
MQIRKAVAFLSTMLIFLLTTSLAFAQEAAKAAVATENGNDGMFALAAGLAIGLAALGGGFGQGHAIAAALNGIARNPSAYSKIFILMILGLALIESLVIYALIMAFMLKP